MKKFSFLDLFFICAGCIVLLVINYLGYSELLSRFSYLILLTGYFSGKFISALYFQNHGNSPKGNR